MSARSHKLLERAETDCLLNEIICLLANDVTPNLNIRKLV